VDLLFARHDGPAYPYSSHQERAILLVVIPTAVAVVICALRIYSRVITKSFGTDDWLMCAATVCLPAMNTLGASSSVSWS
jgi:hypothetical protein